MSALLTDETGAGMPLDVSELDAALEAVLAEEGADRPCDVSVTLVAPERIRELNAEWRGIDAPTDVLSFECDSPFDAGIPAGEPVELGDVVLCPEVIAAQAPAFGNTAAEEFRLMLVHGLLHLMGHDHMDEDEAARMEAAELSVLRELARRRGDDPDAVRLGPMTRHADD